MTGAASAAVGDHVDVVIIGAGLSGVGAAWHLLNRCPWASFVVLEGRDAIGGTWDLFRYPGIRSDSDMYTLGYRFRPWTGARAITDGPAILRYVRETARDAGIDARIRFNHRVVGASWSSADACWTVDAQTPDGPRRFTCRFLHACSGYYRYDEGYLPPFPGRERFAGTFVHPQHWPEDLDYAGKRVAVIGSGATAVTMVPEMAKTAAHVTMVQRSPTYVVSRPATDAWANRMGRVLPPRLAYRLVRWRNVLLGQAFFRLARSRPAYVRKQLLDAARAELGDEPVARHFTPGYNPWDQRLCLVPDGDLFASIRDGRVSVATGRIRTLSEHGIELESGERVAADIIIAATGLNMAMLHGVSLAGDGVVVRPAQSLNYKGIMFSDVPNFAATFGYTNASWTLKADLVSGYVCRLLNHMRRRGYVRATPRADTGAGDAPFLDFTSGYVQRALDQLPRQGSRHPWKLHQNYLLDLINLRFGRVGDAAMEFRTRTETGAQPARADAG